MRNTFEDNTLFWSSHVFLAAVYFSFCSMVFFEHDLGAKISNFLIAGASVFILFALVIIPFISWLFDFIEKSRDKS